MSQAADPITAAINYLNTLASGAFNLLGLNAQKKIVKQEGLNLEKLTEQEKLRYYQAIQNGNTTILNQMLLDQQNKTNSEAMTINLIIGFTFLIVLVAVFIKIKKK